MDSLKMQPLSWSGLHRYYHFRVLPHVLLLQKLYLMAAIGILVVLVVFYKLKSAAKRGKLPPGPWPWPIVGSFRLLGPLPHQSFAKLAKQYGPIFYLRLGTVDTVVVSSPKMAEEVLKTQDNIFASRANLVQGVILNYDNHSVGSAAYGPYWRAARKVFTTELLPNKRVQEFQTVRKDEAMYTLYSILEECKMGRAVRMDIKLGHLTKSNITRMMINKDFFRPNSSASNLKDANVYSKLIRESVTLLGVFELGDYIPFLKNFDLQGYKKQMRELRRLNDVFFDKIIDEHRQGLASKTSEEPSYKSELMDLVDVMLTRPSGVDEKPMTDLQIKAILMAVVLAGTDTSSITMEWVMTELLRHPATLQKVQDELDSVVGKDRLVEETDIPNLKYLSAVVKESSRLHPVLPILINHYSMEATELGGYHIPKDSQVFVNTWAIGRDPASWDRPLEFDPERFLTNGLDFLGQDFQFLPFGSGRRSCPGRNLALVTVQYTLAVLLQACSWTLPPGVSSSDLDVGEAPGLTVPKAIPLEVIASPRIPVQIIDAYKKRTP